MTTVRLGYVAMSMNVKNSSPSQTMTYTRFEQMGDRAAAIRKLERLAQSNIENCIRLLKHNVAHDIRFFRLSSRLVPLATHEALEGWDYLTPIKPLLAELGEFVQKHDIRIDFHPDHFVLLNSPKENVFKESLKVLKMHYLLLKAMGIDPTHRCVMHVGGQYKNTDEALERFVTNWGEVPKQIQQMIMLENDDKSFHLQDTLYLCEKLGIPLVFDVHHHLAYHEESNWAQHWERVVQTWTHSPLPIKMHISSPKSAEQFRAHADYIDSNMFTEFLQQIKGTVPHIDCMIEAKQKDNALFKLMKELKRIDTVEIIDGASFCI